MQNQIANEAELLEQILPKPSDTIIIDRFHSKADAPAPCGATCSGQCHGFV
jgi:hypothetical protein